jgi:hypothetical protein
MATPDNGVCAAMYSASEVNVKVADGTPVRFVERTHYPFEDTIAFQFHSEQSVRFPMYLRVPAWCADAEVTINGQIEKTATAAGQYIRIERQWNDGDRVTLRLPMNVTLTKWNRNHDSVSVNYGALTFSLKIGERYEQKDSKETAIGDSRWQQGVDTSKWPSYEIHPTTAWNYGLVVDETNPENSFTVVHRDWPSSDFPFTLDDVPITIRAKAKQIPEWTLDRYGLCSVLQDSPVRSSQPEQTISLVPMGAARLRISAFPVIGDGQDAHTWMEPAKPRASRYRITASHTFQGDSLEAMDDGLEPNHSGDHSIPRFTWWDHRGTSEWVQYEFPQAREVSEVTVYWFDDTGRGECRIPESWQVLYRDGNGWKPVSVKSTHPIRKDQWNTRTFAPVKTSALRIEVRLSPEFSGGILEWRVK